MDRPRVAVSVAFALQGLTFAAVVTQTPRLQDRFDLGEGDVTLALVVVAVVAGVGSTLAGGLAARRGGLVALRTALVGIAVGAAAIGVAPSWPALVAAFAVYGLGLGAMDATTNIQGVRLQASRGRSLMTGFHAWWSVGGIAGAGYAALSGRLDVPVVASLLVLAAVLLAAAATLGGGLLPDDVPGRTPDPAGGVAVPWPPVLLFGLVLGLYYAADTGTATWSSVFLDDALGASAALVPLGYAAYQGGALASRLAGDLVVRRVGAPPVVLGGTVLGVLGFAGVVAASTPVLAVVAFAVAGLGIAVLAPLAFAALAGSVRDEAVDEAVARMNVANYVGAILGGGLVGAVAEAGDVRWAFVVPLVLVAPIALLARRFRTADGSPAVPRP